MVDSIINHDNYNSYIVNNIKKDKTKIDKHKD
jgi:hypothetical protein